MCKTCVKSNIKHVVPDSSASLLSVITGAQSVNPNNYHASIWTLHAACLLSMTYDNTHLLNISIFEFY